MERKTIIILICVALVGLFLGEINEVTGNILKEITGASLYAEKIPDPSRFIEITPLWSSEFELQDGTNIITSELLFDYIEQGEVYQFNMFYINDGVDEWIASKGTPTYSAASKLTCDDVNLEICVDNCNDDKVCQDECEQEYCASEPTLAPDGTKGIEYIDLTFFSMDVGGNILTLDIDPATGQLIGGQLGRGRIEERLEMNKWRVKRVVVESESPITNIIQQSGFLSAGTLTTAKRPPSKDYGIVG